MGRDKPGLRRIKTAMLDLLETRSLDSITVAELCEKAQVSRTTFYHHFANVHEVYRGLVRELVVQSSTLRPQLRCSGCEADAVRQPLCELIRSGGPYAALAREERFVSAFLVLALAEFKDESLGIYEDACMDQEQAQALYRFQMIGCIGLARSTPETANWEQIRGAVDTFICGGLNAVRARA